MFPVIQIGPLALQTPGLIIILGIWFGLTLAERHSHRYNISPDLLYNLVFISFITGVLGARIVYAVQYFDAFVNTPLNLFSFNPGLLDPIGGIGFGFLAALIYGNRKNIPFWEILDALTLLLAVTTIAFYLSQFASGDAFGIETTLPWGIHLWGTKRHPTQIYNIIAATAALIIIWPKVNGTNNPYIPGKTFLSFLALSAGARLFLDAFRGDSVTLIFHFRNVQVVAWCLLAITLWLLYKITKN